MSSLDALIDKHPVTFFQWRLFVLAGIGWGCDMFAFTAVGKLINQTGGLYGLAKDQDGLYSTVLYVGMFFGAEIWARVCDAHGRKIAFVGTLVVSCIFYGLATLYGHYYYIMICMFGIGVGSGGGLVTRGTLLVEWLPAEKRGTLVGALGVFWPIGGCVCVDLSCVLFICFLFQDNSLRRVMGCNRAF
jgi:MFS family permease